MHTITKAIIKYWWTLPLLLALLMITMTFLFTKTPSLWETLIGILLLLTAMALIASWVLLLARKRNVECFVSFVVSGIVVCFLWLPLVFSAMSGPDGFGKSHPIPEGLRYNLPLSAEADTTEIADSLDSTTYLQLWSDVQGGQYKYDFYYGQLPSGEVFLRCFEVTGNIPLSEDRLREQSRVTIPSRTQFGQVVGKQAFTIYEGDWEDYYAARIEVWFRNAETNEEQKLLEKVYRVDGWMR